MVIRKAVIGSIILLVCGSVFTIAGRAEVLKREPPMGALKEGERVLVDDRRCPAGQISEVVGGNHLKVAGTKRIERTRRCVPKR